MHFHYRSNLAKINDQIFQQIEKTLFLAHFGPFFLILVQKKLSQKIRLCHAQLRMSL